MALSFNDTDNDEDDIVAEINITPLTDIFLVLLIIFMISSSAMLEGGMQVKLPSAKASSLATQADDKPVYVTLATDGAVSVNNQVVDKDSLEKTLSTLLETSVSKTVIIRGDKAIELGKAVYIMDAARAAGAQKIALATQPGEN